MSSEPYQIERLSGQKPVVHLLADAGFSNYSTVIMVTRKQVEARPEVVRAFIEASTEGWYSYLFGDPAPGDRLIRQANKDMPQDVLDNARATMQHYGIVDSGDSLTLGIGAMTETRWGGFFETMTRAGLYRADMPWRKAFVLDFVNQGHGLEMKPK